MAEKRTCPQCCKSYPWPQSFIGKRGKPVTWCDGCRALYRGWNSKTLEERRAARRGKIAEAGGQRQRLYLRSGNRKLGGIPVSITDRGSCPSTCAFNGSGCYAEFGKLGMHWSGIAGDHGDDFATFLRAVRAIPAGQLWRHNEAGDLAGNGRRIDVLKLRRLVDANAGRRGFTFTHHRVIGPGRGHGGVGSGAALSSIHRAEIARANARGFTINLSADTLEQADELAELEIGPVAVVLPAATPDAGTRTPGGRRVVVCPAQTRDLTCAECRLCAHAHRKAIVGFRAHGQARSFVEGAIADRERRRLPVIA